MANMSYCRFQNTLKDLRDCWENLDDDCLSESEFSAREKLINLCKEIVEDGEDLLDITYSDQFKDLEDDDL